MSTAKRTRQDASPRMVMGFGVEKPVTAGQLINVLAEAIARLSHCDNSGEGDVAAAVVESLVGVIAGLSRLARETSSAVRQSNTREHDALSMLAKFKKIAKQQKDLIDLHEAKRREEAEKHLAIQPPPPPPPITTMDTGTSTDLTGGLIAQQIEDGIRLRATMVKLDEKEAVCAQLEEKLMGRVVENRRLKIVVKHAQEVIESQKVLLDEMRDARKRGFLSKSHTPSRENTAEKLKKSEPLLSASSSTPSTIFFPYVGVEEEETKGKWEEAEHRQDYSGDESERETRWQNDTSFDLIQEFYNQFRS